jgi:hypothetical protein
MPKFSKQTATDVKEMGPVTDRPMNLGGFTVSITTFHADIDGTPMMKGLPDDRCQCPHWGYVLKGKVTFRYAKGEEAFEAGDAFYTPPGHIPVKHEPGTELLMISPADELQKTNATMQRNMQAMQAGKH